MKKLFVVLAMMMSSGLTLAHSGDTDANGCHTNHKTGDYHCHRSR